MFPHAFAFCKWYANALTDSGATVVTGLCHATTDNAAGQTYTRLLIEHLYCSSPQRRLAAAAAAPAAADGAAPPPAGAADAACTTAEMTHACATVTVTEEGGNRSICLPEQFTRSTISAEEAQELDAVVAECLLRAAPEAIDCTKRRVSFFKKLGCAECGAEAAAVSDIVECCQTLSRRDACTGACMREPPCGGSRFTGLGPAAAPLRAPPQAELTAADSATDSATPRLAQQQQQLLLLLLSAAASLLAG
eukprot:jgi/Ulvmu1/6901/UM031_0107.1